VRVIAREWDTDLRRAALHPGLRADAKGRGKPDAPGQDGGPRHSVGGRPRIWSRMPAGRQALGSVLDRRSVLAGLGVAGERRARPDHGLRRPFGAHHHRRYGIRHRHRGCGGGLDRPESGPVPGSRRFAAGRFAERPAAAEEAVTEAGAGPVRGAVQSEGTPGQPS
jgi:hypothetical protein